MNINVDRTICDIHAQCVYAAPDVFSLDDDDELVYDPTPPTEHHEAARNAALVCPLQAIRITEDRP